MECVFVLPSHFTGLLDDDMSVSLKYGLHAFYNIDSLIDFLMSVGMRPIFELSFMPSWLTSGNHTVCHYKVRSSPTILTSPLNRRLIQSCIAGQFGSPTELLTMGRTHWCTGATRGRQVWRGRRKRVLFRSLVCNSTLAAPHMRCTRNFEWVSGTSQTTNFGGAHKLNTFNSTLKPQMR